MNYRIIEKEAFQVVGIRHKVKVKNDILSPTYEDMIEEIGENTMKKLMDLSKSEPLGIVHVTTNYKEEIDGSATFH